MVTAVSPLGSTAFARRTREYGKVAKRRRETQSAAMGYPDAKVADDDRRVVRKYWPRGVETSYFPIVQPVAIRDAKTVQKHVREE